MKIWFSNKIYAPLPSPSDAFHRIIYVFCCKNGLCHADDFRGRFQVLRCQLPKSNSYYIQTVDDEFWVRSNEKTPTSTCFVCGQFASNHCGKCKFPKYCSRDHQIIHWKAGLFFYLFIFVIFYFIFRLFIIYCYLFIFLIWYFLLFLYFLFVIFICFLLFIHYYKNCKK